MRLTPILRLLAVLFLVGLLVGLPLLSGEVLARNEHGGGGGGGVSRPSGGGGGGARRGGGGGFQAFAGGNAYHSGFGGGSFRSGPQPAPRAYARAGTVRGPHAGPGPYYPSYGGGWGTSYGPAWEPYYGPDWGSIAAGAVAALVVGTFLEILSGNVQPLTINGQTYYYDGTNYYQSCYQGTESGYCVVPPPTQ